MIKTIDEYLTEKQKSLLQLGRQILTDNNFCFSHSYWILDENKSECAGDCDDPGIYFTFPDNEDCIGVSTVIETGDFSYDAILVSTEEQLKSALGVIIPLIKNWHKRLSELEEEINDE